MRYSLKSKKMTKQDWKMKEKFHLQKADYIEFTNDIFCENLL